MSVGIASVCQSAFAHRADARYSGVWNDEIRWSWSHWTNVAHVPGDLEHADRDEQHAADAEQQHGVAAREPRDRRRSLSVATAAARNGTPRPRQYTAARSEPRHAVAPGRRGREREDRRRASDPMHGDQPTPKSTPRITAPPTVARGSQCTRDLSVEERRATGSQPGEEQAEDDRDRRRRRSEAPARRCGAAPGPAPRRPCRARRRRTRTRARTRSRPRARGHGRCWRAGATASTPVAPPRKAT